MPFCRAHDRDLVRSARREDHLSSSCTHFMRPWISTTIPADRDPQLHGHTLPWQILKTPAVATMPRSGSFAAKRADGLLLNVDHQTESVSIAFDAIQDQSARVW